MRFATVWTLLLAAATSGLAAEISPPRPLAPATLPAQDPHAAALYAEAVRWQGGDGGDSPIDLPRADALLRQAAALGDTEAMDRLGDMSRDGEGGANVDWDQARAWYEKEAAAGGAWGMFSLAEFYRLGQGVEKNPDLAERWAQKAFAAATAGAARGELKSIDCLAWCYAQGVGTTPDVAQQTRLLTKAAAAGYPSAMVGLASTLNQQGNGETPEVLRLMTEAANKGIASAAAEIGLWYLEGAQGLPDDPDKGLKWLARSADMGRTRSMQLLGTLYLRGQFLDKNEKQAVLWFTRGAEKQDPASMRDLAACYEDGVGVDQDYALAAKWYQRAADKNDPASMLELAKLYELGTGVNADAAQARKWYEQAAQHGSADAQAWVAAQAK